MPERWRTVSYTTLTDTTAVGKSYTTPPRGQCSVPSGARTGTVKSLPAGLRERVRTDSRAG
jgi:hypothetical protein